MSVASTIEDLKALPPEDIVVCQVVDQQGNAWSMFYEFVKVPNTSMVMLRIHHPHLKQLPNAEFVKGERST